MNVFQQLWQNWVSGPQRFETVSVEAQAWVNELNQAVFKRLEKNLPSFVKVRTVTTPAFLYYTEAAGGYGVDTEAGIVRSYSLTIPVGSIEKQADAMVERLTDMIVQPGIRTVFFYMPVFPFVRPDGHIDESNDKIYARVRFLATGETVDVGQLTPERNT